MAQLLIPPKARFVDSNGDPLVGGKIYSYEAGTSTPLATYTDKDAGTPNANPVILNSRGEADIWLSNSSYKISVYDSDDNLIYTVDDLKYINDGSIVAAMLASDSVTTAKIEDGAVTFAKLASGTLSYGDFTTKTADYTVTSSDDIIVVNAISGSVTLSLPAAASNANKILNFIRIDNTVVVSDVFQDGDVTVGFDQIAVTSHPFINLQRVQLTTSGTLPTGLSLATDYYIIYVDANTIKLADSAANAAIGTAVDITAASGGGNHTITKQSNTVTIDGYMSETIDGVTSITIDQQYAAVRIFCDRTEWYALGGGKKSSYEESSSSGAYSNGTVNSEDDVTNLTVTINCTGKRIKLELLPDGSSGSSIRLNTSSTSYSELAGEIRLYKDSVLHQKYGFNHRYSTADTTLRLDITPGSIQFIDDPGPGTYTYKIANIFTTAENFDFTNVKLVAYEI